MANFELLFIRVCVMNNVQWHETEFFNLWISGHNCKLSLSLFFFLSVLEIFYISTFTFLNYEKNVMN